jgi:nicotinate-nucleotide--dimethylbenzimidazole phosphoribosyltransferase
MRDPVDPDHLLGLLRSSGLPGPDEGAAARARARDAELTKPAGALGRLEELAVFLSAWQGRHPPRLDRVRVVVFAGWHGVAAHGVSAYPAEVTAQMVANFRAGGAAVNRLAEAAGAELAVEVVREGAPTADLTAEPAMSAAALRECLAAGAAQVPDVGLDLLAVGEMGIANTTAAAAVAAALYREPAAVWAGPGTGLDAAGVARKAAVVEAGWRATPARWATLSRSCVAWAATRSRPWRAPSPRPAPARPGAARRLHRHRCRRGPARAGAWGRRHCLAAHRSAEPRPRPPPRPAGLVPLLDLGLAARRGLGSRAGVSLLRGALACHTGNATFRRAAVSRRI